MLNSTRFAWLAAIAATMLIAAGCSKPSNTGEAAKPDRPDEALRWRTLAWRDENGKIPVDGLRKARAEFLNAQRFSSASAAGGTWTEIGPNNVSGRSRVVLIHPTNTNKMWLGTVSGGIWYTSNGGSTWAPVGDKIASLNISDMKFDPADPNIMYAGTGEGYWNGDALQGSGLLKSTNGGTTWSVVAGTAGFGNINKIAISPTNSNVILVTTQYGGIRRTTNGGTSWSTVYSTQVGHSVQFHPTDGTKAVASVLDASSYWFTEPVYSTDGGATWTKATGLTTNAWTARIELAYSPSNPNNVYAAVANEAGDSIRVFRSINGGASYTLRGTIAGDGGQQWYNNSIWVDPTNDSRIVVTGVHTYMSTNTGAAWTQISNGYIMTNQPHPDIHYSTAIPGYNGTTVKTFFVTTDGGLFKTTDITTASTTSGWTFIAGPRSVQYYGIAGDGATMKILGGTQDNGTLFMDGGSSATMEFGGDGGWVAMDPTNTNYLYGEYVYLLIHRSTDGGATANYIVNGLGDANAQANFIAPFIMDPNNVNRLLAGGASLWRTNDAKAASPTWASIKGPATDYISAIAVAPGNSDIIWVGHNDGRVYKTTNGTVAAPAWTVVDNNSSPNPLPNRYITRILVDPANANTVYVTLGGFDSKNVWKTTNGGTSWTALGAHVSAPVRTIARHPDDANKLWIGTEVGVCFSSDGGTTWSPATDGPANVSVDELNWMHGSARKLLAGTHGRGAWVLTGAAELAAVRLPTSMRSGTTGTGYVDLTAPAPAGGIVVTLTRSPANLTIPASVTVNAGLTSASFSITAGNVSTDTVVTVTGTNGTVSKQDTTTVLAHALSTLTIPATIASGGTDTGTVTLGYNAPTGGVSVALSSNSAKLAVPATVTVAAGTKSADFTLTASTVTLNTAATVTATVNSSTKTANTTIVAGQMTMTAPATVGSGKSGTATVTLGAPAPSTGAVVALTRNPAILTMPTYVTVPAGATSKDFTFTAGVVGTATDVELTASFGGQTVRTPVQVQPPVIQITLSSYQFVGGGPTNLTATIGCGIKAPAGGLTFNLTSSRSTTVSTPATATIPAGAYTVVVPLTHYVTGRATNVILTAKYGSSTTTKGMWVYQPNVTSVVVSPDPIVGGAGISLKATVTIGAAAPTGGSLVVMSSSDSAVCWIAGSLLVPAGKTSHVVYIRHYPVVSAKTITIKGTTNKVAISDTVVVNPPNLYGNGIAPNTVVGGSSTVVTGTVILDAPAPAGGFTVALVSNRTPTVTVPASVFVPAGLKQATYTITHKKVNATTSAMISATLKGITKNGYLSVTK